MLDQRLRAEVERRLRPIGSGLRNSGFTADQITLCGLAASLFTGVAIATGHFGLAAAGLALAGLTDVLDGAVAKSGGETTSRGAFFDSVADRVSDAVVLGGAAWWLAGSQPRLTLLPFAVAALSMLVSYERARAEALGFSGRGGLMERAERMLVLGFGLTFGVLVPALWVLLVTAGLTVGQRFVSVWQQASTSPASPVGGRGGFWMATRPAGSEDSRLSRWGAAARPPGERRHGAARWHFSSRPRASTATPALNGGRLARWWADSPSGESVRTRWQRLRGRSHP